MPVLHVQGDPLLTQAQTLAFGHNARARSEWDALPSALLYAHPTAFAAYSKACRRARVRAGDFYIWRAGRPLLAFLVIRESAVGATRLRYVQSALLRIARDYRLEGIHTLAIAPLGSAAEWPEIRGLAVALFRRSALPVVIYDAYRPGVRADEAW